MATILSLQDEVIFFVMQKVMDASGSYSQRMWTCCKIAGACRRFCKMQFPSSEPLRIEY